MATTLKSTYESILFGRIRPCSVVLSRFSPVQFFTTPWTVAHQAPVHGVSQARILEWVAISFSRSLFKFMSIESVMPSNHLIFCHPLLDLPSIFISIRVFSNESALCIRWPKYWSFSFSISPSNEYSGLISFKIDWFDLLAIQEIVKSSPQLKSISSMVPSPFYGQTLTSIHDYW